MRWYRVVRDHVSRPRLVARYIVTPVWVEHIKIGAAIVLLLLAIPVFALLYAVFGIIGWAVTRWAK